MLSSSTIRMIIKMENHLWLLSLNKGRFVRNYYLPNRFERFLSAKENLLRRRFVYNNFFMDRNELTDGNLILSNGLDRDLCRYDAGESCARDANRLQRFKGDNRRVLWLRFLICPVVCVIYIFKFLRQQWHGLCHWSVERAFLDKVFRSSKGLIRKLLGFLSY